jgi:plasmid stabilization system protein ParE
VEPFVLILSSRAKADIRRITRHIAKESGMARARAVEARINRGVQTLTFAPNAGRLRDDLPKGPRTFVVSPWVIIYRPLDRGRVLVARILDGRMDIPNHLKEL